MNWNTISEKYYEAIQLSELEQQQFLAALQRTHPKEAQEIALLIKEENQLLPMLQSEDIFWWDSIYDLAWEGKKIGVYEVKKHLGSGGMGAVLLAERIDGEFEQTVALKVVRPSGQQLISEDFFRQERQILAHLQHPNIARLLGGGMTDQQTPYFTMEYVEGDAITTYAYENQLAIPTRLHLILQVVAALEYAHQNLVIHLDLKPSNILVDQNGTVKLLDFGIAQVLQQPVTSAQPTYTLKYASPEQINQQPLTTASDVYSLGVILKALLLDEKDNFDDLNVPFTSDLQHICTRATNPKSEDRYSSISELSKDIHHYLNDEPLASKNQELGYVMRKSWRRNRVLYSTLFLALLLLIGTVSFYTYHLQQERQLAEQEAQKAKAISNYLVDIFTNADPNETPVSEFTAVDLLSASTENLEEELSDQPEILAELYDALGMSFNGLGLYNKADSLIHEGLTIKQELASSPNVTILQSWSNLADIAFNNGAYERADSLSQLAHQYTLQLFENDVEKIAKSHLRLANLAFDNADFEGADSLYHLVKNGFEKVTDATTPHLTETIMMLGATNRKLSNYETAERFYLQSLRMNEQLYDAPHPDIAYNLNHLASLYYSMGDYEKAVDHARRSRRQRLHIFGEVHQETIASQGNLARSLRYNGQVDSAIYYYRDAIEKMESVYGTNHPNVGGLTLSLASVFLESGRLVEAQQGYQRALTILTDLLPPKHPNLSYALDGLGLAHYLEGNYQRALSFLQESLAIRAAVMSGDVPQLAMSRYHLGRCLVKMRREEEGRILILKAKSVFEKAPERYEMYLGEMEGFFRD
ncbi:MAG: serine/threonine-protein kinase [Bacteroidota bacterium]